MLSGKLAHRDTKRGGKKTLLHHQRGTTEAGDISPNSGGYIQRVKQQTSSFLGRELFERPLRKQMDCFILLRIGDDGGKKITGR